MANTIEEFTHISNERELAGGRFNINIATPLSSLTLMCVKSSFAEAVENRDASTDGVCTLLRQHFCS